MLTLYQNSVAVTIISTGEDTQERTYRKEHTIKRGRIGEHTQERTYRRGHTREDI